MLELQKGILEEFVCHHYCYKENLKLAGLTIFEGRLDRPVRATRSSPKLARAIKISIAGLEEKANAELKCKTCDQLLKEKRKLRYFCSFKCRRKAACRNL